MSCGKSDLIDITVKHVDEKGKDIAPVYKAQGYAISEFENFDINPKEIEGYELVAAPEKKTGWLGTASKSYEFVFKYKKSAVKPADKTALEKAIRDAKAIENDNYTDKSWNALQNAIKEAKVVLEDEEATQAEVNAQVMDLENAIKALKTKPESGKSDPENPDKPNAGKPGDGSGNGGGTEKPDSTDKPNAGSDASPKTGDAAQPFVYVVGMLAAVGVCAVVFRRKRVK